MVIEWYRTPKITENDDFVVYMDCIEALDVWDLSLTRKDTQRPCNMRNVTCRPANAHQTDLSVALQSWLVQTPERGEH